MRRFSAVLASVLVVALIPTGSNAAEPTGPVTFGASLSQAPNVNFDCSVIPYATPMKAPGSSCTWGTPLFDVSNSAAGGLEVPGNGTVYQVKLRVGASTGPMEIVVLRTLFNPDDLSSNHCCVEVAKSSEFTPVANGITTLNVDLPVGLGQESENGATVDYLDSLGLSILEDGVTVPAIDKTSLAASEQDPVDTFNAPALTLGQSQLAGDPDGYELDMQATWYPAGQSPAGQSPPGAGTTTGTTPTPTGTGTTGSPTAPAQKQKLQTALKACKKDKSKSARKKCDQQARREDG